MKPNTKRTKESMLKRLREGGFDLETVGVKEYPEVREKLGWSESTFKTALRFIGGRDTTGLSDSIRDYIPTDQEAAVVMREFGSWGIILVYTGCRFGEIWHLDYDHSKDMFYMDTSKGGDVIQISCTEAPSEVWEALWQWYQEDRCITYPRTIRKRWDELRQMGLLGKECVPHNFRHRFISALGKQGLTLQEIGKCVGHKDPKTTYRYFHLSASEQTSNRNKAWKE